jgi:hypothetical protein
MIKILKTNNIFKVASVCLLLLFGSTATYAQITISSIQDLSFGTLLTTGTGGTATISNQGVVTTTGNVIALSSPAPTEAIFRISNSSSKNKNVSSITKPSYVTLTRSGGGSMRLVFGTPSPNPSFSVPRHSYTDMSIGGTLTIGTITANPAGDYSATFSITFNHN